MELRVLSGEDVATAIDMPDAIEAMASAFGELSAGTARVPTRVRLESDAGVTLAMPAYLGEARELGAKLVSLFPGNMARALPAISGIVILLDGDTGLPKAVMDGTRLTATRTAAGSGLATRLLSPEEAGVLTIFGAGPQARAHLDAMRAVRPIREVRVVASGLDSARRFARDAREATGLEVTAFEDCRAAVEGTELIVCATTSATPVFDGHDLSPGTHVNGVGSYTPAMQEVDAATVMRSRVVVDSREGALAEAGDLLVPIGEGRITKAWIDAELGEIVNGDAPPGAEGHELTFFKSVGNAAQDVAIAARIYEKAEARGLGTLATL